MALFPPIIDSVFPAFAINDDDKTIKIVFSFPNASEQFTAGDQIEYKINRQDNNGFIKSEVLSPIPEGDKYFIELEKKSIFKAGFLYKIQLRVIRGETKSEWSAVMITKAINQPKIEIEDSDMDDISNTINSISDETPLFRGICEFNLTDKEFVDKYCFTLYNNENVELESSGWIQHTNRIDTYRFKTHLINNNIYKAIYQIVSNNGYEKSAEEYKFKIATQELSGDLPLVKLIVNSDLKERENAYNSIALQYEVDQDNRKHLLKGNYVLTRTSNKSNYQIWENLKYFAFQDKLFEGEEIYRDYTIESGIKYKYAFQMENGFGLRTDRIYAEDACQNDFEYSYLFANNQQLKLKFNNKIATFKHTTLSAKTDTIGSKYPTITRNGYAYYAEFPITGLISLHMDEHQTFFVEKDDGYYCGDELVIPADKYRVELKSDISTPEIQERIDEKYTNTFNTHLTHDNIFIERKFREKVEEFLNNGKPKLFKSPTEGNILVALTNVTMTPNAQLGRAIYEFSATAYEIAECTLENLDAYSIINIGEFSKSLAQTFTFGQIKGNFIGENGNLSYDNLYELIKKQVRKDTNTGNYYNEVAYLKAISIEQYPVLDFRNEIATLQEKINKNQSIITDLKDDGKSDLESDSSKINPESPLNERILYYEEEVNLWKQEIENYKTFRETLANEQKHPFVTMVIDGKEMLFGKTKYYQLEDIFDGTLKNIHLKYSMPLVINYICATNSTENKQKVIQKTTSYIVWGQLAGIFTDTSDVLFNYNPQYNNPIEYTVKGKNKKLSRYKVPSAYSYYIEDGDKFDNVNFDLYKTQDIMKILKQECRLFLENLKPEEYYEFSFAYDEDLKGVWRTAHNEKYYFNFDQVNNIEIEADPGTRVEITKSDNSCQTIIIGESQKYIIKNSLGDKTEGTYIHGIRFVNPTHAIINYQCSVTVDMRGGIEI